MQFDIKFEQLQYYLLLSELRIQFRILNSKFIIGHDSECVPLARPDLVAVLDRENEHAPVTDLSGPGGFNNSLNDFVHEFVWHDDFDFDLRQERDAVLLAAIDGGVPFLSAKAAAVDHRQAKHLDLVESLLDRFDLRRLNNGND